MPVSLKFVLIVAICLKFVCAGMTEMSLLNPEIDSKHRAAIGYERQLEPLCTRTQREDWMIHKGWVEQYVLYLFVSITYIDGTH